MPCRAPFFAGDYIGTPGDPGEIGARQSQGIGGAVGQHIGLDPADFGRGDGASGRHVEEIAAGAAADRVGRRQICGGKRENVVAGAAFQHIRPGAAVNVEIVAGAQRRAVDRVAAGAGINIDRPSGYPGEIRIGQGQGVGAPLASR